MTTLAASHDELDKPRTEDGLTSAQVQQRVERGFVNATDRTSTRSVWQIIKVNVLTRFNAILGALFVLVLAAGSPVDGLFGVALIFNSAIGIVQEVSAKRKLDRLALLNSPTTRVIREGELSTIATGDVVRDDLIELRTGDQVPSDGTLIYTSGLEIDESNLTGESDAVPKAIGDEVLSGTTVVAGAGRFHAAAVGADAYANKIASEARKFKKTRSEIQESINTLLKYITWVIVIALPLQIWSQWRTLGQGRPFGDVWQEVMIRSAAGLVGLVPEGLVLLTSVAFLLAAVTLTKQQVLVQELPAVEGLARVDVVCLDKTGTLTVGDIVYEDIVHLAPPEDDEFTFQALGAISDDPNANATLSAIAAKLDPPKGWVRTETIAFNSARKWSAASFEGKGSWVIGAPDMLLTSDDEENRQKVQEIAATGRRVLILAHSENPLNGQELPQNLRWMALVVLGEQVRPDAAETLKFFADQGVLIKVISGDNPTTVAAIARRVGLTVDEPVDARTIGETAEELREIAEKTVVFGRVSPQQKRALVQALQLNGHVVAMTGDGVNDALALKDADIGVAMGNGAQATKAVAQLVLLDGKFSHLPNVLAEGRRVIGNVERVANLFVAKNVMSLIAIVSAAILFLPFPFLPRHLTLVSTVTIGVPAFFLALGPNRSRYVPGFLKRVLRFAVPAGVVAGLAVIVSYLITHNSVGASYDAQCNAVVGKGDTVAQICQQPGTVATLALMIVFFWILVVLARPFALWKAALISVMALIAVGAFALPLGRSVFDFDMTSSQLMWAVVVGAAGAALIELIYRTSKDHRNA
ncbi:HAD-IC family P-type ATPase [Nakamurella antarctica]|uniref:HAD-IC family P-type ATPase n=1 Tax=Nakamurella antarctica TaxID=1902245 RepID=UPI001EF07470|nr:HAD-IC family P-type ATPase [Nakamurella antarctica]